MVFKFSFVLFFLLLCMPVCSSGHLHAADINSPMEQVRATVEQVISVLSDQQYEGESHSAERRDRIVQIVNSRFNLRLMAKLTLGKTWNGLTSKEQNEFVELFSELMKNTYIRRVEGYSGEKIIYNNEKVKDNRAVVYSVFVKNNTELSLVYKMREEGDGQWLVYDVVIEGASVIKQYRRQFAQIIKQEKFNGLILRLEKKNKAITQS